MNGIVHLPLFLVDARQNQTLLERLVHLVLALVVGGIFGLFHVDLFRLFPVAFIGVILTAVTLMTGSIFPAVLWHALNNGWGLIARRYELPLAEMGIEGHILGAAVLALALWIIWKNRTPYPGLRPWRR